MSTRFTIGLTGNIATGKSTVAGMLEELGATAIDADRVTHEVMRAGTEVHAAILDAFGPQIVDRSGEIDRKRLGEIVFSDPQALRRLERIVHPAVTVEIARRIAAAETQVVVVEAIKLIESGTAEHYASLWVTACPPGLRVERLVIHRGLSREEARRRVHAQPPQAEKIAQADVVIDTSGDLEDTREQVEVAWQNEVQPWIHRTFGSRAFGV